MLNYAVALFQLLRSSVCTLKPAPGHGVLTRQHTWPQPALPWTLLPPLNAVIPCSPTPQLPMSVQNPAMPLLMHAHQFKLGQWSKCIPLLRRSRVKGCPRYAAGLLKQWPQPRPSHFEPHFLRLPPEACQRGRSNSRSSFSELHPHWRQSNHTLAPSCRSRLCKPRSRIMRYQHRLRWPVQRHRQQPPLPLPSLLQCCKAWQVQSRQPLLEPPTVCHLSSLPAELQQGARLRLSRAHNPPAVERPQRARQLRQ